MNSLRLLKQTMFTPPVPCRSINTIADLKFISSPLILIVEDEPEITDILKAFLARDGFRTVCAFDGQLALDVHLAQKPDLILLDVQMPRMDGWKVLAEIRRRGETPVIMLTAHDQDIDKLVALRMGADDYVVKPFNPAEVSARVGAVLRRAIPRTAGNGQTRLRSGPLEIDLENYEVCVLNTDTRIPLILTLTEFRLLAHLARAPKRVFSRSELLTACLSEGNTLERTVDSHVSKLRRKLEDAGVAGVPASIRGVGYRLEESS